MENYRKLKPRLRRFVEAIAAGKTGADAVRVIKPNSKDPPNLAWKLKSMPFVRAAIQELEKRAMEEAGVTIPGVVLRMNEIANRCMQVEPVRDRKGEPIEGEYTFDAVGANRALENLAKYGLRIAERTEVTGRDGEPLLSVAQAAKESADLIRETNDPNLAAQVYGDLMTGRKASQSGG